MKAFVLQMTSTPDVNENLAFVEQQLSDSCEQVRGSIVVLPECFACFGGKENLNFVISEPLSHTIENTVDNTPVQTSLARLAKKYDIYLVAGTFPIKVSQEEEPQSQRVKPMTLVFSPSGERIGHYQKIHLFDVDVSDNTGSYRESDTWQAGRELAYFDTQWGRIGLAICYDVRFPSLFQKLTELGCKAVVLPSAFTQKTGQAHWQILLQARAIENQIYMIACDQSGIHTNQRETFGNSMIVNPWGDILCNAQKQLGLFGAELDSEKLNQVRQAMPLQQHNQFSVNLISRNSE